MVYSHQHLDALFPGFTVCDSYDKAKKTIEELVEVEKIHKREDLAIAEVFGVADDFESREDYDYLLVKSGRYPKVKLL